jgi:hypothetical protein
VFQAAGSRREYTPFIRDSPGQIDTDLVKVDFNMTEWTEAEA